MNRSAAGNASAAAAGAVKEVLTARNTSSNSRVNSAMKELFTMRNKMDEEDDLFRGAPLTGTSSSSRTGNVNANGRGAAAVGKGDVTSVLNQFRETRMQELQAERDMQRSAIKRMLSPPTLEADDNNEDNQQYGGNAVYDRSLYFGTAARNRFYAEYSEEVGDGRAEAEHGTFSEPPPALEQRHRHWGDEVVQTDADTVAQDDDDDDDDITPPPINNSPGLAFYDFVRSPKGKGRDVATAPEQSGPGGKQAEREASPPSSSGQKMQTYSSMLDMPDMNDDGGSNAHLWEELEILDPYDHAHSEYQQNEDQGDEYNEEEDETPNTRLSYGVDSVMSEPAVDQQALENTLRNQAMLYESSMQLGGAVSSWAFGGSVESVGVMNSLGQVALGSIEKLDQEEGSLERPGGDPGRSVTFAEATDVREFDKDPGEMSEVDRGGQPFSRGSHLEEEDRSTYDQNVQYADDSLPVPLYSDTDEYDETPLRFPDHYGYPRGEQNGASRRLYSSLDSADGMDAAHAVADTGLDMHGLGAGKGIFFGDEDEEDARSEEGNANAAAEVESAQKPSVARTRKKKKSANPVKKKSTSALPHRIILDQEPPKVKNGEQLFYSGNGNEKIFSPGSPSTSPTQEPYPEHKEPSKKTSSDTVSNNTKSKDYSTPARDLPLTLQQPATALPSRVHENAKSSPATSPTLRPLAKPKTVAPAPIEEIVKVPHSPKVVDNTVYTISIMGETVILGGPAVPKGPSPAELAASAAARKEKKRVEEIRLNEMSRPTPDKTLKPGHVPKAATDCPNIPMGAVDQVQEESGQEDFSAGFFDPSTEKVRIVLRAQLQNDDRFRELLKKLPKQKKQYGRTELKIFRDNLNALEPTAIVDSLFGGTSKAWKKVVPRNESVELAANLFGAKISPAPPAEQLRKSGAQDENAVHKNASSETAKITSTYISSAKGIGDGSAENNWSANRNHSILSGQPVGPYSAQHFLRRFSSGFVCVAVDFYMCFVGTYDLSTGEFVPGLNFDPKPVPKTAASHEPQAIDSNGKPVYERPSVRQANLLEIDFSCLPSNIFALVPVILDECTPSVPQSTAGADLEAKDRGDISPLLQGMVFDCCLYSSKSVDLATLKEADADFSNVEQSALVGEINGNEKAVTGALKHMVGERDNAHSRKLKRKEQERMLMQHLAGFSEEGSGDGTSAHTQASSGTKNNTLWSHNTNMLYLRASNVAEKVKRRGSVVTISQNMLQATPMGRKEALIPFVLYRRSTLEKGWAWKSIKVVTKGVQSYDIDHILNTIMENLVKLHVMPLHSIHVEHCDNCENHAMTTRHTPGHYRKYFDDIKASLHKEVPQLVCARNLQSMLTDEVFISGKSSSDGGRAAYKEARVGSFEVIMRPYCSSVSQVIYSKLATNAFPRSSDLINVMMGYLHPKPTSYSKPVTLDIIVYDKIYKRPVPDLDVAIYLIDINMAAAEIQRSEDARKIKGSEVVSGLIEFAEDVDSDINDEQKSAQPKSNDSSPSGKSVSVVPLEDPTSSATLAKVKRTRLHKSKVFQLKGRKELTKGTALRDVSHSIIQDPTFSALGSWGKRDVLAWFESHGASQEVRFFAEQAGVTSGHAVITQITDSNLSKWGCTNKRVKHALLKDVARMKESVSHDQPSVVGLSNHRIQHMLETSEMMKTSLGMNNSVAPQSGLLGFGQKSEAYLKNAKKDREDTRLKSLGTTPIPPSNSDVITTKRLGRNMNLVTVASGKTSVIGMTRCTLTRAGSYVVKVSSPDNISTWSSIIAVGADAAGCQFLWAGKISPKMGLVRVQVSEKVFSHVMKCATYSKIGLMVPFTNMSSMRQHILYIQYNVENLDSTASIVGEMFLPVGSYFSNICGTVLHVSTSLYNRVRIGYRRFNKGSTSGMSEDSTHTLNYLSNEETMLRWHNRVILAAAKKVQSCRNHLRRLRATRLSSSLALGIRIRMVMRGFLKRARMRLLPKRVTRIQSAWRGHYAYKIYQDTKERLEKLKALAVYERRKTANKRWTLAVVFVQVYLRLSKQIQSRRFIHYGKCVTLVQSVFRRKAAYIKVAFYRKMNTWSAISMFFFKTKLLMKVLRRRKQKQQEAEDRFQEGKSCEAMEAEEARMRRYDKLRAEQIEFLLLQERKKVHEALRQMEMRKLAVIIKENKAAVVIQAFARGCDVRNWRDLYLAKSRGIVHTVHGNRPIRRKIYLSDSESDDSNATHETFELDQDASLFDRTVHTVSSKFRSARRKMSKFISSLVNRQLKTELEQSRRQQYRRTRTYDPDRFKERRRMSLMYKLPGHSDDMDDGSEIDEDAGPPEPKLSAFRRYVYENDIITTEMKHKMAMAKERVRERAKSLANATKSAVVALPGKLVEPISKIAAGGFKGLLVSSRYVGLAGVRHLRRARKRIENTKLPTVADIKNASVHAIQESIDLPKKLVVRSGILRPKSKNMRYMTSQQKQTHAVTLLQASYRGYRARNKLLLDVNYRNKLADLVRLGQEQELAKLKAAKLALEEQERAKASLLAAEPASPEGKGDAKTALHIAAISGLKGIASGIVSTAGELLKDAAAKAKKSAGEYADKKKITVDRAFRRASGAMGLNDALLQISGTLTHCPTIDRQWHIGVYPKGSIISQGLIGTLRGINSGGADHDAQSISDDERQPKAEAVKSRDTDEHFRSVSGYPLDKQTFAATSFHAHLADLSRYHELEVVIFVETIGVSYTPPAGTLPNQPFDAENAPAISANSFFFAPAFFAQINLAGGSAFPASGGRMHVKLRPNPSVVGRLPGAKKFLSMDGLGVVISLMPVALPPTRFLRTFRGISRPAPCYPSALVDAMLLEGCSMDWEARNGTASSVGSFRDRLLVATASRGVACALYEYTSTGTLVGQLNMGPMDRIRDITIIVSGTKHAVCCGSNGTIMIHEYIRGGDEGPSDHSWGTPCFMTSNEAKQAIAAACMASHAGMDLLFTAEKNGSINVILLDRGVCIRQYQNETFCYPEHVTCMSVCALKLYIGLSDGTLIVVSLHEILERGNIDSASQLASAQLSREHCFRPESGGITCMCVVSGNNFLGFRDEDEIARIEGHKSRKSAKDVCLEGHLVLVGGGDKEPTVKVLQPQYKGMRLLSTLAGHTSAVTSITADAAGRHFFTASADDHNVLAWDGLTFLPEKRMGDMFFRGMALADDCMLVITDRSPYVKFWRVREQETVLPDSGDTIPARSAGGLVRARLDHEASSYNITTMRGEEWLRSRLRNLPPKPDHHGKIHPVERCIRENLDPMQSQLVLERWITQYIRQESIPSMRPTSLLLEVSVNADAVGGAKPISRAKFRRAQQAIAQAEKMIGNTLPGSPQHHAAMKTLSTLIADGSPGDGDEDGEDSPEVADKSILGTTFGNRGTINKAKAALSPEMQRIINASKTKGRAGIQFADEDEDNLSEESNDENVHGRLFPGISPEKNREIEADINAQKKRLEQDIVFKRRLHRLNNNPHFSDSDEEKEEKIKYIKPIKLTKTQIREKAKDLREADKKEKGLGGRSWVVDLPDTSTRGGGMKGLLESLTPKKPKSISTAVLLNISPSPDREGSPKFEMYYSGDDHDDENENKTAIAKSTVKLWVSRSKGATKKREKNFFKGMVRELRDLDADEDL